MQNQQLPNADLYRNNLVFGDPLEKIWKECVFGFCGIQTFDRRMFRVVADRTEWLSEVAILWINISQKASDL